jgi:molybdopterin/thiamine biosynthesis adenylyltransferase/rhodanese-related sulfurtransferase
MAHPLMSSTYRDLLAQAQATVPTLPLEQLRERLLRGEAITLLDVREREERREGVLPGALLIPRGFLEMQAEQRIPDREATVVVYCASGLRSIFAAQTLLAMGYRRVYSATPGFLRWKELGFPVEPAPELSDAQRERYARHLRLPEVGEAGQARLLRARVLLLGAGGLGSPAALYLAAAGVGTLGVMDADRVEVSNLQRQILHTTGRVGQAKVKSAEETLRGLDPGVRVIALEERLTGANVERVLEGFDLVVDGSDNYATRYLLNDASVRQKKPVIHGSIFRFEGQATTFVPGQGPCYRCLFPAAPPPHLSPSCEEAGVLGVLPGLIGVIQATEALKYLLGLGDLLVGRLLTYDSLAMKFRELKLRRYPGCPACGDAATEASPPEGGESCGSRGG